MSSSPVQCDHDTMLNELELEWRRHYEAAMLARADFQYLAARKAGAESLDLAKERLDRAEAHKARVLATIDRLSRAERRGR